MSYVMPNASAPDTLKPRAPSRRNQIYFVLFVWVVVVVWCAGYWLISRVDNVVLWTYQGTSGPFAVALNPSGEYQVTGPISSVQRGGMFGYSTTLCISPGVAGLGVTELILTDSPGSAAGEVVNRLETPILPDGSRCGPRIVGRMVPVDAPLGHYELRRQLLLTVGGRPQKPIALPSIYIRVVS